MKLKKNIEFFVELYLSMFNKRDDTLYVFGAWFGNKFSDNSMYFYEYCLSKKINAVWITKDKEIYKTLSEANKPVALDGADLARKVCKKAKFAIHCTGEEDFCSCSRYLGNAVIINLWHGIPLKKIMFDNKINSNIGIKHTLWHYMRKKPYSKQYHFSTSPAITKIYKSCFRTDDKHIIEIGQARNDCFFDGSLKKRKYADIDYDKTIFYMPTHRNEGKTEIDITKIFDLQKLNDFCKQNRVLFVIKKHFYHREEITNLQEYSNIVDLTRESLDSQESLFNADILVTDYSSCYIDYLLLSRPVVFYNYDYENYLVNDREMYFDYDKVTPGPKAKTFDEFLKALEQSLNGNAEYKERLEKTKDLFYSKSNQGMVCPQILDAIGKLK